MYFGISYISTQGHPAEVLSLAKTHIILFLNYEIKYFYAFDKIVCNNIFEDKNSK